MHLDCMAKGIKAQEVMISKVKSVEEDQQLHTNEPNETNKRCILYLMIPFVSLPLSYMNSTREKEDKVFYS